MTDKKNTKSVDQYTDTAELQSDTQSYSDQSIANNLVESINSKDLSTSNSIDNGYLLINMQRFTASTLCILNLLKSCCHKFDLDKVEQPDLDKVEQPDLDKVEQPNLNKVEQPNLNKVEQPNLNKVEKPTESYVLTEKDIKSKERLLKATEQFLFGLMNKDEEFDYPRFIKKVYNVLKIDEALEMIKNKDSKVFMMKGDDGKIITIIPGIDIKFAMKLMDEEQKALFWQYFYLFIVSTFNIIIKTNPSKKEKFTKSIEIIESLNEELQKTGIMVKNQIFNPFTGLGIDDKTYTMDQMISGSISDNSTLYQASQITGLMELLNMMGFEKVINPVTLKETMENITEEQIVEAKDQILKMLGAEDNEDIDEVCGTLIRDIVENIKLNGMEDIGKSLMSIAANTRNKIDMNKMKTTESSMNFFMKNSLEKMKDMKDENGSPIGQNIMSMFSQFMPMPPSNDNK